MPIRFRCSRCNRLLGIARRKAGTETTCPHCGSTITVPQLEEPANRQSDLAEIDELLNPVSVAPAAAPAHAPPEPAEMPWWQTGELEPVPAPAARPAPAPKPTSAATTKAHPKTDAERPLFERDLDAVLGTTPKSDEQGAKKSKPESTAGADALSLGDERNPIVLSVQTAIALGVAVVVLLVLSFAAGYLVASR